MVLLIFLGDRHFQWRPKVVISEKSNRQEEEEVEEEEEKHMLKRWRVNKFNSSRNNDAS